MMCGCTLEVQSLHVVRASNLNGLDPLKKE